jgi:hypothetical protein
MPLLAPVIATTLPSVPDMPFFFPVCDLNKKRDNVGRLAMETLMLPLHGDHGDDDDDH